MQTFEDVIKKWWPYVRAIANNNTGGNGDAIASEVFEKLQLNWKGDYDTEAHIKKWLRTTTVRLCVDYIRRRTAARKKLKKYTHEIFNDEEPSTEQDEKDKELFEIEQYVINFLTQQIENLPPRTKQVFKMHYLKGLNYRQIAEQLGVDKNTITNQMQTARELLRLNVLFDKKAAPMLAQQLLFKPGEK